MTATRALGERAQAMIDALAAITAEPGKVTRLYLTPEHKRATELIDKWMREAGLAVRMDAAATVRGYRAGEGPKRLLVGSHIDTVIDGGRYDGNLGVVAGIIAASEVAARGIALPFGLEVLAFGDEEGVRFPKTLLGSSVIAGSVTPDMLGTSDARRVNIADALRAFGGDPHAIASETYKRDDVIGYLELHIEQGPVLEKEGEALGVVSAIASQGRYRLGVKGEPGHAGTVPMALRHDALAAAAEVIALVEDCGRKSAAAGAVATVGEIAALPGASNVIPGEVRMSLDLRAPADRLRQDVASAVRSRLGEIAERRGVALDMETVHEKPVAICAPWIKHAIAAAIERVTGSRPRELMSGAGHDGQAMVHLTDVGMIFVRCRGGISHSPLEFVSVDDLGLAVEALIQTIVELAHAPQPQPA